jgi:hypothetical protein
MSDKHLTVRSSHLALRLYEHDGWTKEIVESCLERGALKYWGNDERPYWVLEVGSRYNLDKLRPYVGKVLNWLGNEVADAERFLREMMW